MSETQAAKLLTSWGKINRKLVAVTKADYDLLLYKVAPVMVAIDSKSESKEVLFVTLNREAAMRVLRNEYNLHEIPNVVRGNTERKSGICSYPNFN